MASIYSMVFILQFLVYIGITLVLFYNVMNLGKTFDMKTGFILLFVLLISYGAGMVTTMLSIDELLYYALWNVQTWMLPFNVLFFIIHLILNLKLFADTAIERYSSNGR